MQKNIEISVDKDFARFGGKAYAINKINSVEVQERHPYSRNAWFGWGLLAFICAIPALGQIAQPTGSNASMPLLFLTALFGFLAYRAWVRSKIVEYQLLLRTSSRDAQALTSLDGDLIESLRDRIERAMAGQLA